MKERRPMEIQKRGGFALHPTVLAEVQGQLLLDSRFVFFELQLVEDSFKVLLDRRSADTLRKFADCRADVDAGERSCTVECSP